MFTSPRFNTSKPEMLYLVMVALNTAVLFALQGYALPSPPALVVAYSREIILGLLAATFLCGVSAGLQHADRKKYPWRAPRARITALVVLALVFLDAAAWLRFQ